MTSFDWVFCWEKITVINCLQFRIVIERQEELFCPEFNLQFNNTDWRVESFVGYNINPCDATRERHWDSSYCTYVSIGFRAVNKRQIR